MSAKVEYLQERIMDQIGRLTAQNKPMTITGTYKGILLTHPIRVLNILPDRVIFQAPGSLLCLTLREKVHLYSNALPETVTARLLELNMIVGEIALSDFTFSGLSWKERLCDRIQPRDPIGVDFYSQKTTVRGHMENISTIGMRLLISRKKDKGVCTDYGAPVRLAFRLPGDSLQINLKGKITYSRQVRDSMIIGIHFLPNPSQEKRLTQYILASKAEILDELELEFQKMLAPRQIQDLYF